MASHRKHTHAATGYQLTPRMAQALKMLVAAGSGCLTKSTGQVLCAGSVGEEQGDGGIHSRTWLQLVALGLVAGQDGRIVPTLGGIECARRLGGS